MTTMFRAGIRLDGDASGWKAATVQAEAATQKLNESTAQAAATQRQMAGSSVGAQQAAVKLATVNGQAAATQDRLNISTKQYQQAMRPLPAQVTDVATSLASGSPAWLVAIQQGGQIKDSFGGVGAAFRGVLSLLNPVTLGIGAVAAATAAAVIITTGATAEQRAFEAAIRDTNNAAGTTTGQLNEMAKAVAAVSGTRSQAAGALAALTGSGKVDGSDLERFTQVAVNSQRVLGTTVEQTVAAFTALGKDPVGASIKLNDAMNYLTASTLAQIRALQSQGRQAEAASLAQNAYAEATAQRTNAAEASLGSLERAWMAVKGAAAEGWSAMLNLGRKETLEEELERINKVLAEAPRRGVDAVQQAARRQTMERRREDLRLQILMEREAAAAQSTANQREQKDILAQGEAHQSALNSLATAGAAQRLALTNEALTKAESSARVAYDRGQLSAKEHSDLMIAIERARVDAQVQQLDRLAAAEAAKGSTGNPDDSLRKQAALMQIETRRVELRERRARLEADIATGKFDTAPRNDPLGSFAEQQIAAQNKRDQDRRLQQADFLQGLIDDNARANVDLIRDDETRGRAQIELDRQVMERRIQLMGLTGAARETAEREMAERVQLSQARLTESLRPEWQRLLEAWNDPIRGMSEAFDRGITQSLRAGEDAWVQLATTGKLSIGELGRSILVEASRATFKQFTTMLFNLATRGVGGAGFGSGFGFGNQDLGQFFHGGGRVGYDTPAAVRPMPSSTWASAPRLHGGYLAPDEYPAILQRGESVLTPGQMGQLSPAGQGNVQVTLINQSGTPLQASAQQQPGGGVEVMLTAIKESIAGDIGSGTGSVSRALQGRYGLRPSFSSM
jgi:phage-related minor tail protein